MDQTLDSLESLINPDSFIVSKSDKYGTITYVNSEFIRVTGFEEHEVLGQPHNIIRHPDVPSSVFQDLWKTIKNGEVWRGVLKNKTKQGGFYWVDSTVFPTFQKGEIIGYMSVRRQPTREQIEGAEKFFLRLGRAV